MRLPDRAPRKVTESAILRAVLIALNRIADVRATRNNSGALRDETGRLVRYGLGEGSPDVVGIITVRGLGIAFGLEVKRPGGRTAKDHHRRQIAWREVAKRRGMFCEEVRSVEEALSAIQALRELIAHRLA